MEFDGRLRRSTSSARLLARAQLSVAIDDTGRTALEPARPGVDGAVASAGYVFFDRLKNRSAVLCATSSSGNRTKNRAYYRRRHAPGGKCSEAQRSRIWETPARPRSEMRVTSTSGSFANQIFRMASRSVVTTRAAQIRMTMGFLTTPTRHRWGQIRPRRAGFGHKSVACAQKRERRSAVRIRSTCDWRAGSRTARRLCRPALSRT
jgi:hypothetical protein